MSPPSRPEDLFVQAQSSVILADAARGAESIDARGTRLSTLDELLVIIEKVPG